MPTTQMSETNAGGNIQTPASPIDTWLRDARIGDVLECTYSSPRHWLADAPAPTELFARLERHADGTRAHIALASGSEDAPTTLELEHPIPLQPVHIAKPWGHELWFSGMEARGVSRVGSASANLGLPDLLALAPSWFGGAPAILLLKILAPHAHSEFGELYLELHEQKREVYVATDIDAALWPDGVGGARLGIAAAVRHAYDDAALRRALRNVIAEYETIRRQIDAVLDQLRRALGMEVDAPLALADAVALAQRVPEHMRRREQTARAAMQRFLHVHPLRVGDVLAIPPRVPHALLPGVRVVEFQSPVYERRILAFGQKVLTQPHWDTDAAIAGMELDAPMIGTQLLQDDGTVRVERIVAFTEFTVLRIQLAPNRGMREAASWQPPRTDYALCIAVSGRTHIGEQAILREQAWLLARPALRHCVQNAGVEPATILWATPT